MYKNLSTDNIIIVENNRYVQGFLSNFEYAKVSSNQSLSSDPKTVYFNTKDRCCLYLKTTPGISWNHREFSLPLQAKEHQAEVKPWNNSILLQTQFETSTT